MRRGTNEHKQRSDFLCRDVKEVREKIAALAAHLDGYL
jgi:hypothetical protein